MKFLPLAALALLVAPAALAGAEWRSASYAGPSAYVAPGVLACGAQAHAGAVCFALDGWERTARVVVQDQFVFMPGARWAALDASLHVLAEGNACWDEAQIPSGAAFFAVHFPAETMLGVIPECRNPATTGVVHVRFA